MKRKFLVPSCDTNKHICIKSMFIIDFKTLISTYKIFFFLNGFNSSPQKTVFKDIILNLLILIRYCSHFRSGSQIKSN